MERVGRAGGAFDDYALNTCPAGGALVAALGDKPTAPRNVDRATWAFAAPAGGEGAGGDALARGRYGAAEPR